MYTDILKQTKVIDFDALNKKGTINSDITNHNLSIKPSTKRAFSTATDSVEVTGIMNEAIVMNLTANWSTNNLLSGVVGSATAIIDKIQGLNGGGADLRIDINFNIIDSEAIGSVLDSVRTVNSFLLPRQQYDLSLNEISTVVSKAVDVSVKGISETIKGTGKSEEREALGNLSAEVGATLKDIGLDVTESPVPVEIRIGNYFYCDDMVITQSSCVISEEQTAEGSLYATVSMSLVTRENVVLEKDSNGKPTIRGVYLGVSEVSERLGLPQE
jgi:hypothetical protein